MFKMLSKIDSVCGTPFYIAYPDRFVENIQNFQQAFKEIYPKFILSYSFKTNYTPPLLNLVKENDCFAETVSRMEYEMALSLGFAGSNIIFNGPVKRYDDIVLAINNESVVNLDGEYEVEHVLQIKKNFPKKTVKVGLRINMEIETDSGKSAIQAGLKESRFGFTTEVLKKIIPTLKENGIIIHSLHGHTSSTNRIVENYRIIASRLVQVCKDFELNDIRYIDVGGGFFGAAPEEIDTTNKPSYEDYAKGICETLLNDPWFCKNKPYIVIEPGTSVVANVFELVTKIIQHKNIRGKNFVICDAAASQVKPARGNTNYPFKSYSSNPEEDSIVTDIVGSTCMEVDKISSEVNLTHYSHGDFLVYKGVGAYRNNITPFFINPRSPIVNIGRNGDFKILRKRQTAQEMLSLLGYDDRK